MRDSTAKRPSMAPPEDRSSPQVGVLPLAAALLGMSAINPALAQSIAPPPLHQSIDAHGVDVLSGTFWASAPAIWIGEAGDGGLVFQRSYDSAAQAWRHNWMNTINSSGTTYTVTLMGRSESFTLTGGSFTPAQGQGSSLSFNSGTNIYTYTGADGSVVLFDKGLASSSIVQANEGRATSMTRPSGEAITLTYVAVGSAHRLSSVNNNFGYQLKLEYQTGSEILSRVVAINNAVDYCNPTADTCSSFTQTWPSLTFNAAAPTTVVDALGRTTIYSYSGGRLTGIRWPGNSGPEPNIVVTYSTGMATSVVNGNVAWLYAYTDAGGARTTRVTLPNSVYREVVSSLATGLMASDRDPLNNTTSYQYDAYGRLTRITAPEGNYTDFAYDARGNVTTTTQVAKSGSGLSNIVTSASFDSSCSNPVTCNRPNSTADANGAVTDFTYDATHGRLLTVTLPDPDGAGSLPRPQTRYAYTSTYAYYKNSGGSIVAASSPVYRLTQTSACATSSWSASSCSAGNDDETRTTISYGSTGVANNLAATSISVGSGSGSLIATTALSHDHAGNLLTIDGPLPGTGDTTRLRYDAARQRIGVVGPDPDGGGALKHRATRITYNTDGWPTLVEQGVVDSQSDGDWAAFTSLQQLNTSYDPMSGRPTMRTLTASGATHAVSQFAYDTAGRLLCAAQRMNPAQFGALPASACTLSIAGAAGADRIVRNAYDANSRITSVTVGYGTSLQRTELSRTYTANGMQATLTDAGGNVLTYEYDGFDRLRKLRFPNPSGGGSSTTDYEQFTYDTTGNPSNRLVEQRRRDGATLSYAYDNLGRVTTVTPSANGPATTYAYDNFSRLVSASASSRTLTYTYDQLSRVLSEQQPLGAVSYQWDLASRRTQLSYPGGLDIQYAYDLANALTSVTEANTTTLVSYAYDNLGRRTGVARGNGTSETATFDAASRLIELTQDLAGTGDDLTLDFTHNAAGAILTRDASNSAFAWSPPAPGTANYADNGLNQYTSVAGAGQSYDSRGNLTTGGYGYDIFNRLVSGPSSATLAYDPAGRLYETAGASATTRFLYDGAQLIAEYDGTGALMRRYVPGAALDEPVLWYEGAGTSDRRWLAADERGSVIAVIDASGAATAINSYDEYGMRGSSNVGRFQYTGQAWLAEVSLYHYRARAYSPSLGRFMQTDPILHAGGMNLYAYVGNDPVNAVDPWGLFRACWYTGERVTHTPDEGYQVTALRTCLEFNEPMSGATGGASAGETSGGGLGAASSAHEQCPAGPVANLAQITIEVSTDIHIAGLGVHYLIGGGMVAGGAASVNPEVALLGVGVAMIGQAIEGLGNSGQIAGAVVLMTQGDPRAGARLAVESAVGRYTRRLGDLESVLQRAGLPPQYTISGAVNEPVQRWLDDLGLPRC